uniref:Methylcrotonoyl-CoA carboxylase subunit alpha, mitochondrial n=1 Tax=Steinernema glaseri TaxID=37863 RepID=A0A1I7YY42_9BILA
MLKLCGQRVALTAALSKYYCTSLNSSGLVTRRIEKVLIANRGEIAIRVMKTARKMGIKSVAVFSDADRASLHTRYADEAYHVGEPAALKSYLDMKKIINTAKKSNAQAIHPGYGFLSENAEFADMCAKEGIAFIGPPTKAIRDMGTKSIAKQIMSDAGVPVINGYHGNDQSDAKLLEESKKIGFPVMLKAVYGGGGKGMRIAFTEEEFAEKLESARSEARKSFGNDDMLVEKYVERPRHVFGDTHGNYVYLWERDCSVQRRHQKIIEEAPAPGLTMQQRRELGNSAVCAARAVNYVGAGTVEFIMDAHGKFYFMEMNTRLQVEHPVSEAITGTDLVEWQLKVAQGEQLPLQQEEIKLNGHSLEARIYAEDTKAGFMPIAGDLEYLSFPKDARVDTGVEQGDEVSVHYDPMIAKVIVWGADRDQAIAKLDSALYNTQIGGLLTNVDFVRDVLKHEGFVRGDVYTDFIRDHEKDLFRDDRPSVDSRIESVVSSILLNQEAGVSKHDGPINSRDYFRLNHVAHKVVALKDETVVVEFPSNEYMLVVLDGHKYKTHVYSIERDGNTVNFGLEVDGKRWNCKAVSLASSFQVYGQDVRNWPKRTIDFSEAQADAGSSLSARAPMPGVIDKVLVKAGDSVKAGQALVVMVAMKMEYIIRAPTDNVITAVSCKPGANVAKNATLVKFEFAEE